MKVRERHIGWFEKFRIRYLVMLGWTFLVIFEIVLLLYLLIYGVRLLEFSSAEVGMIGGVLGGVIGGILTLFGVLATLNRQKRREFIDKYPIIKDNTESVINIVDEFIRMYELNLNKDVNDLYLEIDRFKRVKESVLLQKAIQGGGKVYLLTYGIKSNIDHTLGEILVKGEFIVDSYGLDRLVEVDEIYFSKLINCIKSNRELLAKELSREDDLFRKYTNFK